MVEKKPKIEEIDEEHKKIREEIAKLEQKKLTLEDEKRANEGCYQALARYRGAREEALRGKKDLVKEDKALDEEINKLEKRVKGFRSDLDIIAEQEKVDKQIEELWRKFYETEITLSPLHLRQRITYENNQGNIQIRPDEYNDKLWYYENSQYATPQVLIQKDDKGRPVRIMRFVRNSETRGYLMKVVQDIIIEEG